jgi:hypothetical protein
LNPFGFSLKFRVSLITEKSSTVLQFLTLVLSLTAEKCPYGWDNFGDYCYQIRGSDADVRTWEDAQAQCVLAKGQLARITE